MLICAAGMIQADRIDDASAEALIVHEHVERQDDGCGTDRHAEALCQSMRSRPRLIRDSVEGAGCRASRLRLACR